MTNRPGSVSAALIFILLNALVWLALGVIIAANLHPGLPDIPLVKGVMAFLSFGAAAILLGLLFFLRKRSRPAWFLALGFLTLTCLLTFFDQFGLSDLVIVILNIIPIILLIKERAWFLPAKPAAV
jgi:lysylphosphatidylglycerol synthetase-like protein (DUF2156 family)